MAQLTENALEALQKRYLLRDAQGEIIEVPEELWWRIANAIASVEEDDIKEEYWAIEFHKILENLDFLPNTPTIINAGKEKGQLSACFVLPIEDSMEGIFTTLRNTAIIHKTGGGTGFDFSSLRPEGSMVSNKTGVSTGPLAFCQVYDKATEVVKQGSTRRGANMMCFSVHHPDIMEFLEMKMTPGVMTNFNVSVTITNEFMEAVENDTEYDLYHPFTGTLDRLRARTVWNKIASNAHSSAEPGLIFIDRVNETSPYWETISATNPCGEQPLPPYGSCNLGSINLANFAVSGPNVVLDWDRLGDVVRTAVRFLDNVIDANHYPIPELQEHALRYRNIGLGVMGWASLLIKLGLAYNSKEAVQLGEQIQEFINTQAHEYSWELAREKGTPSAAPFKTFFSYSHPERRNATLTTVAPTGSISIIAGTDSGIEPVYAFIMDKHVMETVLTEYHPLYRAAKNNGGVKKEIFLEAHDVNPESHVAMQAAFQKHCDSAISKTINLPKTATVEDVQQAYIRAWRSGCKGITVYRESSREGVLHRRDEPKTTFENYCVECGGEIVIQNGCESCISCGISKCSIA